MKPISHERITEYAVNEYIDAGRLLSEYFEKEKFRKAVLSGAHDEDDITPSRALNWHFYPANTTIANEERDILKLITLRPTSEWITAKRQRKLTSQLEEGLSPSTFRTFGEILHHIQDMSTPSHVVPVYHDHKLTDPFESFLVDSWSIIEERIDNEKKIFKNTLAEKNHGDLLKLYNDGAARLQNSLEPGSGLFPLTINTDNIAVKSTTFWQPYAVGQSSVANVPLDIKGFGNFGPLGALFGKCDSFQYNGEEIIVNQKVFMDIALFFVRLAIKDTIHAILVLEKMKLKLS